MKKQFLLYATVAISIIVCWACKKGKAKDYASLFKNTVWTGTFKYTNGPVQPVSISFQDGGQITWYELAGEFAGTWKRESDRLTISFPSGSGFKAGISDNNQLTGIENFPVNGWAMVSAELNTVADESLDNTSWQTTNLIINFKAGNKVNIMLGAPPYNTYSDIAYVRKSKAIRFNYPNYIFFTVVTGKTVMKGVNQPTGDPVVYPFQVNKQ